MHDEEMVGILRLISAVKNKIEVSAMWEIPYLQPTKRVSGGVALVLLMFIRHLTHTPHLPGIFSSERRGSPTGS